jgi:spore coat protein JC
VTKPPAEPVFVTHLWAARVKLQPYNRCPGSNLILCIILVTDIGTEELGHLEMVGAICHQLLQGADIEMLKKCGYSESYVEHGVGIFPSDATGNPFNAVAFQSKGDAVTDLMEDLAAEQKAKQTYEYLINMCDDPDVVEPLRFLREREVVHFQRFGECLRMVEDKMLDKKCYIDKNPCQM